MAQKKNPFGFIGVRDAFREMRNANFYRDIFIEAWVQFILVFMVMALSGRGAFLKSTGGDEDKATLVTAGLAGGIYVYVLIEAYGHLQGSTMNSMVTTAFVCTKRISFLKGIFYVMAQWGGGSVGALLAVRCLPEDVRDQLTPFTPNPQLDPLQVIIFEMFFTGTMIAVTLGALDEDRKTLHTPALAIGLTISMDIFVGGFYTGGSVNSGIAFSLCLATGDFSNLWKYGVGNTLGGLVAILMYFLFTYDQGIFALKDAKRDDNENQTDYYAEEIQSSCSQCSHCNAGLLNKNDFEGKHHDSRNKIQISRVYVKA